MLEAHVGAEVFDRGMRAWMALPDATPATTDAFIAAMSAAAGRDVGAFLRPWLDETVIPRVAAVVDGEELIVSQDGPSFLLDVDVDLVTATGTVRRRVPLTGPSTTMSLGGLSGVTGVVIDPDRRLLIHRSAEPTAAAGSTGEPSR
jgi:hypothetical protein